MSPSVFTLTIFICIAILSSNAEYIKKNSNCTQPRGDPDYYPQTNCKGSRHRTNPRTGKPEECQCECPNNPNSAGYYCPGNKVL
ncbi:unnamed protein product [Allacma fusca]|uniref:Secreted protein n=1 Tax=Allacma fusca TaxID=39272 RepID=A0A8J2KSQ3_9HEXA|nr:unnamed protein product [Allacma fusca]